MFPATHNIIFMQWNAHNDHKHFRICTVIRNTCGKQSWADVVRVDEYRVKCLAMLSVVHVGPGWNWTDIITESTSDRTGTGLVTKKHFWCNCYCTIFGSPRNGGAIAGWTDTGNPMRIAHVTAALKPVEVIIIEVCQEAHVTVELWPLRWDLLIHVRQLT